MNEDLNITEIVLRVITVGMYISVLFLSWWQSIMEFLKLNKDIIEIVANIVTVFGFIGLLLAFREYFQRQKIEQKRKNDIKKSIFGEIELRKIKLEKFYSWISEKKFGVIANNLKNNLPSIFCDNLLINGALFDGFNNTNEVIKIADYYKNCGNVIFDLINTYQKNTSNNILLESNFTRDLKWLILYTKHTLNNISSEEETEWSKLNEARNQYYKLT